MRWTLPLLITIFLGLVGCSTARKVSKVGLRELSSEEGGQQNALSEVRAKIQNTTRFSRACPKEVESELAGLAALRVLAPSCPKGFMELVQISTNMLKLEERSLLEEMSTAQCRSMVELELDSSLRGFLDEFEIDGPVGRRKGITESFVSMEDDFKTLERLRSSLNEVLSVNVPFERWIARNGNYVLPEADLHFFYSLVIQNGCRVDSDVIDEGFRAMQTLEELRRLMPDGSAKSSLELFMQGIHKLIDKKVGEYFLSYAAG